MRELKGSGVIWIGDIPKMWDVAKIKHHFNVVSGSTPDSNNPTCWDGEIPWITPADYKTEDKYVCSGRRNITQKGYDSCGTMQIPKNSIVFSKRAPIGSVAITANSLCTNQGCLSCISKDSGYSLYYYYVMSCFAEQFELYGSGTTFKEISAKDFSNFKLPSPSYLEQQRIAKFLDRKCAIIDNVLKKTKASIEEYKKLKQSVITKTIYHNDCFLSKLKYFGSFVNGYAFKSDSFQETGTRVIKIANIQNGTLSWEDESFVDDSLYEQLTSFQVHKGDVVFALTRPIISDGIKTAIVNTEERILLNQRNAMFIGSKSLNNRYLYYAMQSHPFIEEFKLHIDLTGLQPNISTNAIANIAIPYRTIYEQDLVVSYLDRKCEEIDSLIVNKERFIIELEAYRKGLIYEYVTGKKEVTV